MSALPDGWKSVSVGDILELKYGKALPKKDRRPGTVQVFGSGGEVDRHDATYLEDPSIIVGRKGSIGSVYLSDGPCWPIDTAYYVSHDSQDTDLRWLFHRLKALPLSDMNKSAAVPGLNREDVYRLRIPLPPLPEQRRIAAILDKGSSLQERALRRREKTDSLLTQAFMMWFPRNQYPTAPIASLGAVATGKTPPTNDTTSFGGPIPFTTPGDLMEKTPARWLSESGAEKSRVVRGGSALVCCIGATIGKVGIARQSTAFNQQINAVEWDDSIDDAYGYFALRAQSRLIASLGASTTMPILNKGQFSKLTIPVPPISEQRQFGQFFDTWERQQTSHEAQLQTLEALTRALQSRAFRGEL